MPISLNPMMMRQIIMDHYENPRNKRKVDDPRYLQIHMDSASCIDDIYLYLLVENGIVSDCAFDGIACTICTATTSMMTELVKDKTIKEADYIITQYQKMIHEQPYDDEVLEDAIVFMNTAKQASRIKCATLGWNGLTQLLEKAEGEKNE